MGQTWILFGILCLNFIFSNVIANKKAACHDPIYGSCYGILFNCPPGCPRLCEVDCQLCKPFCACDKPGAVCQDPRFTGGDGIMFYFHGKQDQDFCLVSDSKIHINAHFIGKKSKKGRDFTWVQSVGILFGSHQFYIGARKVATWQDPDENMQIKIDGEEIIMTALEGEAWRSTKKGLTVQRLAETNYVKVQVKGLFEIAARVVPITSEESRVHGYDVTEEDCYAHLELNFKFESLSKMVDGVLGQTYRPNYRSRVKITQAMPLMGGAKIFKTSHLFANDCLASKFGLEKI